MHPLREAMLDQMRLRGHSPRTQQSYLNAVSLLSRHYHRSPDRLSQEELQNWILYLVKERELSAATCRLYLNAIRFFYLQVLRWPECQLKLVTPKRPQRIPYLLSPGEVRRIIDHADNPKYAMMLALCYACRLRVSELVALQVSHIHGEDKYCQVVQGKGQKDRQVPLPATVEHFLSGLRKGQRISPDQAATCQNILNCHTPVLGGLDYACNDCGTHYPRYHSCRHRHCPQCQQTASRRWVEARQNDLLPVSYYHLVFTLPHDLNGWAQCHPEVIYHRLFRCAWECLDNYSRCNRQLQGKLGMTAMLHTWGQSLSQHIHLHCLIPGGAIDEQGGFVTTRRDFLYPQRVLARLFRGKMVSALRQDHEAGKLHRIAPEQIDTVLDQLMRTDWVIHTKPHLRQADTVLRYLARYTHRTAISLSRIESVDPGTGGAVEKDPRKAIGSALQRSGLARTSTALQ